jgi:hypothetical protein
MKRNAFIFTAMMISTTMILVSCVSTTSEESTETSEQEQAGTSLPSEATSDTTVITSTSESASPNSTSEINIAGGNDPEDFLMPNVVCMNLQEAQDEIQDHGVFYSRSTDLTGQDRNQIIDSNWVVLEQSPAPGIKIGEGDAILGVVKIGESTRGIC